MTPGDPCQDVVYEFRIVSEHIGTRDLYLANRVFPTLRKWGMPMLEEEKKRVNSFGCLITLSSKNTSRNPAKNGWT
jgi:hypothetical protein